MTAVIHQHSPTSRQPPGAHVTPPGGDVTRVFLPSLQGAPIVRRALPRAAPTICSTNSFDTRSPHLAGPRCDPAPSMVRAPERRRKKYKSRSYSYHIHKFRAMNKVSCVGTTAALLKASAGPWGEGGEEAAVVAVDHPSHFILFFPKGKDWQAKVMYHRVFYYNIMMIVE